MMFQIILGILMGAASIAVLVAVIRYCFYMRCNCQEGFDGDWDEWVCPKHGYKGRFWID